VIALAASCAAVAGSPILSSCVWANAAPFGGFSSSAAWASGLAGHLPL